MRGAGPERLSGPGFVAERVGWTVRTLAPPDPTGNRFVVTVRDLSLEEAGFLGSRLGVAAEEGLPNYFDQQRFGSQTESGNFPGQRILRRDAKGALRVYLAELLAGDPRTCGPSSGRPPPAKASGGHSWRWRPVPPTCAQSSPSFATIPGTFAAHSTWSSRAS